MYSNIKRLFFVREIKQSETKVIFLRENILNELKKMREKCHFDEIFVYREIMIL